jgi:hypothetical protein
MRAAALVLAALAAVAHGAASGREPRAASTMRATLLCVLGAGLVRGAPRPLRRGLDAQLALIERDVAELERVDADTGCRKVDDDCDADMEEEEYCCKCALKKERSKGDLLPKHPPGDPLHVAHEVCTAAQYSAAGIPLLYLRNGVEELPRDKPLFTAAQAKEAKYTVEDMLVAGYTATELKAAQLAQGSGLASRKSVLRRSGRRHEKGLQAANGLRGA